MELMDKIANQFYRIYIEYIEKKDFFLLPLDSEIFQLKMMICSKLKIYEYGKLIILYNGEIISTLDEKTPVSHIFPSNDEEINLVICIDNNLLNTEGVDWNKLTIKSGESLTNQADTLSSNQKANLINKNPNNNLHNNNDLSMLKNSNLTTNPNNFSNSLNNHNNNNFNNHNNNFIHNNNLNISNIQSQSEKREGNSIYKLCGCNGKTEALYVCFTCCSFICESCKRREPHSSHAKQIIRVSKAQDYIKAFAKDFAVKLNNNILHEESYLKSQNFEKHFLGSLRSIELKYSGLKDYVLNLKNNQIVYLNELKDKLNFNENLTEANSNLEEIKKQIDSFADAEGNGKELDFQVNLRKKIIRAVEVLESKMIGVKKNLFFYLKSHKEIKSFNKTLNRSVKEMHFHTQTKYTDAIVNSKLANLVKAEHTKKKPKQTLDQVLIRLVDFKTILYYHFRTKIYKKRIFIDRSEFKANFEINDHIELNIFNKLFVLIGKNHNMFFYYDFDQNEVIRLADSKFSHYCGNMIYIPLNNSIYLLGGFNSKKCEIYRNDDLFFSNKSQNLNNNNNPNTGVSNSNMNNWVTIPELNTFRQESSTALINDFLYIFFGYNIGMKVNNQTIERINVNKNDEWEIISFKFNASRTSNLGSSNGNNENICLNSNGVIPFGENEVLIVGGYDGKSYRDSMFVFKVDEQEKDKKGELNTYGANITNSNLFALEFFNEKIPDINKNISYLFDKESHFINIGDYENVISDKLFDYAMFDSKLRLHLVNTRKFKYEILLLKDE